MATAPSMKMHLRLEPPKMLPQPEMPHPMLLRLPPAMPMASVSRAWVAAPSIA